MGYTRLSQVTLGYAGLRWVSMGFWRVVRDSSDLTLVTVGVGCFVVVVLFADIRSTAARDDRGEGQDGAAVRRRAADRRRPAESGAVVQGRRQYVHLHVSLLFLSLVSVGGPIQRRRGHRRTKQQRDCKPIDGDSAVVPFCCCCCCCCCCLC